MTAPTVQRPPVAIADGALPHRGASPAPPPEAPKRSVVAYVHSKIDKAKQLGPYWAVTRPIYIVTMVLLVASSVWILCQVVVSFFDKPFKNAFPDVIGYLILAIILLEILDTVHRQSGDTKDRLTTTLVKDFLIIGIVSALRHMLVTGADLSITSGPLDISIRDAFLRELLTNLLLIAGLIGGLWLVGHIDRASAKEEEATSDQPANSDASS